MSKVYVTQENRRISFFDAERFGDIIFMSDKDFSPIKSSLMNVKIVQDIKKWMQDFDPDQDFLLLSGDPVLIGYAFHLAIWKKGYIRILKWDQISKSYHEAHFNPKGD